jgi:hypothetical protein
MGQRIQQLYSPALDPPGSTVHVNMGIRMSSASMARRNVVDSSATEAVPSCRVRMSASLASR